MAIKSRIDNINIYEADDNAAKKEKKSKVKSRYLKNGQSISGLGYVAGKYATGALGVVEGTVDLLAGTAALLGGNKEYAEYLFMHDNWVSDLNAKLDEGYNPGKVMRFVGDTASGLGQSTTFLIPGVGQVMFFTGVMGNGISSASQKTGKVGFKEYGYGALSAALEFTLERFVSGSGQTLETITKTGAKNIGSALTKAVGKTAAKNTARKMVATQLISTAVGEGVEEFFGNVGDHFLQNITGVDRESEFDFGAALYDFAVGMASGGLMGGVSTTVQTAYEQKNGAQINADEGRRERMLKQARGLVESAKKQNLDKGSDAVATYLSMLEAGLNTYDGAKGKSGAMAEGAVNLALGKINSALMSTEFNIITDRHAEHIASLSEAERSELAAYANDYFRDAGANVTAEDLRDINNEYTRALATLDWAGNVVRTMVGVNGRVNTEIAEVMQREMLAEDEAVAAKEKAAQREGFQKLRTEAEKRAVAIGESEKWRGGEAVYSYSLDGVSGYLKLIKEADGYKAVTISEKRADEVKLTEEEVKKFLAALRESQTAQKSNTESKAAEGEEIPAVTEEAAEGAKMTDESGDSRKTKLSLGQNDSEATATPKKRKKITRDMSEQERYELLKDRTIPLTAKADMQKLSTLEAEHKSKIDNLIALTLKEKKALFKKIGEEFSIFTKYVNADVELEFELSRGGLDESTQKQMKNYLDYVKMLTCIDQVIENAVGIEVHNRNDEGYKVDPTLEDSYVLISVFESDDIVIPVKLEIKKFTDKENKLYVAITLDGIKKEEIVTQGDTVNGVTQDAPSSIVSIAQLFKKINPSEERFLKYVPKQFFDETVSTADNTTKSSIGDDSVPPREGTGGEKAADKYEETDFTATPQEVKAAMKAVKVYKLLSADRRQAIIEMMRSAGGIDKVTVASIANIMSARDGLHVRFLKGHRAEGSHDVMKSGERLILLNPEKTEGKYWRRDILFHELWHDLSRDGGTKVLTEEIYRRSLPAFQHMVVDRYTKYYNGVSMSQFLDGKKWTEENVKAYFDTYTKISYDEVMEEVAAGTAGRVMGSKNFIKNFRDVSILRRIFYGISDFCRAMVNKTYMTNGEETAGFMLSFKEALTFRRLYELAYTKERFHLDEGVLRAMEEIFMERDEGDSERAKTKKSLSLYEAYTEKYEKLDLNQDISTLDGVPAIKLMDGSILPFTEPHVTFIQNNGIDVEDIESGGWISGGVYEASERSDTMRYKERMLAKKRMDEKRAAKTKMSLEIDEEYAEYNNSITMEDVNVLRSIGRKSINAFSSEDIQKAQKWAYKFYKEFGTKSPFFRAWFGDWRSKDISDITPVSIDKETEAKSGNAENKDTGRKISWSKDVAREAVLNASKENKTDMTYVGANISGIVENAILFDTVVSDKNKNKKMDGTAFMHSFYSICNIDGKSILIKLFAEEAFSEKQNTSFTRAYTIKQIKKVAEIDDGVLSLEGGLTGSHSATISSIADLYQLVKTYDTKFTPAPEVNPALLNEDGTPKVVYHGSDAEFTVFDITKSRSWDGTPDYDLPGFYFSESPDESGGYGENVRKYYIRIQKPYEGSLYRLAKEKGSYRKAYEYLIAEGYDGYIDTEMGEGYTEYIVLKPENIKSATDNIGTFDKANPDTRYSLSLDADIPSLSAAEVEENANRVSWGFSWTDEKLLSNIRKVQKYFRERYPDHMVEFELDNKKKRVVIVAIRPMREARMSKGFAVPLAENDAYHEELTALFRSIGISDDRISEHISVFETEEEKNETIKRAKKKNEGRRLKVYQKQEVAKSLEGVLSNVLSPIVGPSKLMGKKKRALITRLWQELNRAKASEREKLAERFAEELIVSTVYDDYEVNAEYEQMLVDGTVESFEMLNEYRKKLDVSAVIEDAKVSVGTGKANVLRKRWGADKDGISPRQAFDELQAQGFLVDLEATNNEADILIAINEEYERLKERTSMRRELLPLAAMSEERLSSIKNELKTSLLTFFSEGGKDTKYGKLARRYQVLIATKDQRIEEIENQYREKSAEQAAKYNEKLNAAKEEFRRTKQHLQNAITEQKQKGKEKLAEKSAEMRELNEKHRNAINAIKEEYRRTKKTLADAYQAKLATQRAKMAEEFAQIEKKLTDAFVARVEKLREETAKSREYWQKRASEARYDREYAREQNRVLADVRGLRDYLNRDYTAASEGEDRMTRNIAKAILKATGKIGVRADKAKIAAKIMLDWVNTVKQSNPDMVGNSYLSASLTQEEYDALVKVSSTSAQEGDSLTLEELQAFHRIVNAAKRIYHRYDKVWINGKWVNVEEVAREAVSIIEGSYTEAKGIKGKLRDFIARATKTFLDPLAVAAHIDGYRTDGVITRLVTELALAEARKNRMIIELRKPFEDFFKQHKKYAKTLAEKKIKLTDEFEITLGQAITLHEMFKRDQAKAGLMLSRIGFHMDDGTIKKLEGYGKAHFVTTPSGEKVSLERAKEILRDWRQNADAGNVILKELGYDISWNHGAAAAQEFSKAIELADSDAMKFMDQFGDQRKRLIEGLEKDFTDEDREFLKVVSHFFQETSKNAKKKADLQNIGYSNVIEGYYFPIKRMQGDMAKNIADGQVFAEFATTSNISFNQSTVEGAKASVEIFGIWDVVTDHINGLAMWEHLYLPVQNINKVWNKNVGKGTGNVVSVKNLLDGRGDGDFTKWMSDLLLDVQGARQKETKTWLDTALEKLRGGYAVFQLGANVQTIAKQTLSWVAATQYIDPLYMAQGVKNLRLNADKLNTYSAVAAERENDATVVRAFSNTEKVTKLAEKTMIGITAADRVVNMAIWSACQKQVAAENPSMPTGSEENLKRAGKLCDEVIMKVQDSSDMTTKSQAARSSSEFIKSLTMFQSAGLKMFSRLWEGVWRVTRYQKLAKSDAAYQKEFAAAKKQLVRTVGAFAGVSVGTAVIVQLFKVLFNKEREDKEGNEISVLEDMALDTFGEAVGVIPVIGDLTDYFLNGYELSSYSYDMLNEMLTATKENMALLDKLVHGEVIEEWEIGRMIRKTTRSAGMMTGIPIRNVENFVTGLIRRFSKETGYAYDTLFYNANYTEDLNRAIAKGEDEFAQAILELMMKRNKTGSRVYSDEVLNTITTLHGEDYSVLPRTIDTDEVKTRKRLKAFEAVYQKADNAVEKLVLSEEFKALAAYNTEEGSGQALAIKTLYTGYYQLAEHDVLGKELTRSAAYMTVTDPVNLMLVKAYDKAIKLEAVEMTGTRKAMLAAYMKTLGMNNTERAYAAYACGFRTDDVTSKILKDLKGRENEEELLIALGLKEKEEEEKEDAA